MGGGEYVARWSSYVGERLSATFQVQAGCQLRERKERRQDSLKMSENMEDVTDDYGKDEAVEIMIFPKSKNMMLKRKRKRRGRII